MLNQKLIIQLNQFVYQYSLMNIRFAKKPHTPCVNPFINQTRNENNSLNRTQRKSSNGSFSKSPLGDMTNVQSNMFQYKSHKKYSAYEIPVQASTEIVKNHQRPPSSSKLADNGRDMMDFILNLKSKKSEHKFTNQKCMMQSFQTQERKSDNEEYLCNKMLLIRKIEKYQKQAISCFYEKDYQGCFRELGKAQGLLKKEKMDSIQHQLYINYLYSEFYFKLNNTEKWKGYLAKAKYLSSKVNPNEHQNLKEYILNINALEICQAVQEQQYEKAMYLSKELRSHQCLDSKMRRRVSQCQIQALQKLCRFKQAMDTIDRECQALQKDQQLTNQKQIQQIGKLLTLKIELIAQYTNTANAVENLEKIIGFDEVAKGKSQGYSYYYPKLYHLYAELLKKQESNLLKVVFFYQKWIQMQTSKKQKQRLVLELFRIYFDIGIYQRALELLEEAEGEMTLYLPAEYLQMLKTIKQSCEGRAK